MQVAARLFDAAIAFLRRRYRHMSTCPACLRFLEAAAQ
jgi:hypothetical protein